MTNLSSPDRIAGHSITVTGGGPFGRAWFDCTCGRSEHRATKKAANLAALDHHRALVGCNCTPEHYDPCCIERTTDPDLHVVPRIQGGAA